MPIQIKQLNIYPVKSLGGISVHSATLTHAGLDGDRQWMLVNSEGRFVSQRKYPKMATIQPLIENGQLKLRNSDGYCITLKEPTEKSPVTTSVWKDTFTALKADKEYGEWVSDAIKSKKNLHMVYFDKTQERKINPHRFGDGHTFFADGAPYLVANLESLAMLNRSLSEESLQQITMDNFRANIVIDGIPAFTEHKLHQLHWQSTNSTIALKDHCQRCSIITVNPKTGIPSKNATPFQQLTKINPMPKNSSAPAFGVNSVLTRGNGNRIHLNDILNSPP